MVRLKRGRDVMALPGPSPSRPGFYFPVGACCFVDRHASQRPADPRTCWILPARMLAAVRMDDINHGAGAQAQAQAQDIDAFVFCFPKRQMPKTEGM